MGERIQWMLDQHLFLWRWVAQRNCCKIKPKRYSDHHVSNTPLFITVAVIGLSFSHLVLHLYLTLFPGIVSQIDHLHLDPYLRNPTDMWPRQPMHSTVPAMLPLNAYLRWQMKFQEQWPSDTMDLQTAEHGLTNLPWDGNGLYSTENKTGGFQFEWQIYLLKIDHWFLWLWSCNFKWESPSG